MTHLPWWAWSIAAAGVASLVVGALLGDSYPRDVIANLGVAALLVAPLVGVERAITAAIEARAVDARAVDDAEAAVRLNEMWTDFGERLKTPRPLPSTDARTAEAMLKLDGWELAAPIRGHAIWRRDSHVVAVPLGATGLPYSVLRLLRREAEWTTERYVELHQQATAQTTSA